MLENQINGPYLVIVVIGEYPEALGYAPLRAYAQPIYSGNRFVPIEKENERSVLHGLLEAQRMLTPEGLEIAIKKPVFDILTPVGPVRPDFLVDARSQKTGEIRRTIIQTTGNVSSDQPPSSVSMTSRLEKLAPVLNIAAHELRRERMLSLLMDHLAF